MAGVQIWGAGRGGRQRVGFPTWPVSYAANYRGHYDSLRPVRLKPVFTHAHRRDGVYAYVGILQQLACIVSGRVERDADMNVAIRVSKSLTSVVNGRKLKIRVKMPGPNPGNCNYFFFRPIIYKPKGGALDSTVLLE